MKKVLGIICLLLTSTFFVACGDVSKPEAKNEQNLEEANKVKEGDNVSSKSDDLYSFEITLNGQDYTLPADYSEFEKNGWCINGANSDKKVAPNQYTLSEVMKNEKTQVYAKLVNIGKDELSLNQCKIGGIKLDSFDAKYGATLVLPKGISFDSTKDDVIKAYGNPTSSDEKDTQTYMTYEVGTYQSVKITIDKESNKVSSIDIQNFVEKSVSDSNNGNSSSSEVPESVKSYKSPTELSDDILSFNAKYDGVLYNMPVPISELEKNGWELQEAPKEEIPSRDFQSGIVLRKGNQTLRTSIYNNSDKSTSAKNCFVTEIICDEFTTNVSLELPKGITVGSTKEAVEAAYAGTKVNKSDSSTFEYYTYTKKVQQEVSITIKKETGKVSKISVQYVPRKEDYK
ncbi:hypothetical protein DVW08_06535 [Clostridium botulinum]|nr:hypothetical protein [Clostridium botulinum]